MRRRILFSVDKSLSENLEPEAARIVCSKGMEQASSFATRFSIFALVPWAQVFTSGTPSENSRLYCDTPIRKQLLDSVEQASVIAIHLKYATDYPVSEGRLAVVCEISFRRHGTIFQTRKFYFDLEYGDNFQSSERGHWSLVDIPVATDDLENALEDLERTSL